MDVPELEVFPALAEELHFRRTAERLYLSQPRVRCRDVVPGRRTHTALPEARSPAGSL